LGPANLGDANAEVQDLKDGKLYCIIKA